MKVTEEADRITTVVVVHTVTPGPSGGDRHTGNHPGLSGVNANAGEKLVSGQSGDEDSAPDDNSLVTSFPSSIQEGAGHIRCVLEDLQDVMALVLLGPAMSRTNRHLRPLGCCFQTEWYLWYLVYPLLEPKATGVQRDDDFCLQTDWFTRKMSRHSCC